MSASWVQGDLLFEEQEPAPPVPDLLDKKGVGFRTGMFADGTLYTVQDGPIPKAHRDEAKARGLRCLDPRCTLPELLLQDRSRYGKRNHLRHRTRDVECDPDHGVGLKVRQALRVWLSGIADGIPGAIVTEDSDLGNNRRPAFLLSAPGREPVAFEVLSSPIPVKDSGRGKNLTRGYTTRRDLNDEAGADTIWVIAPTAKQLLIKDSKKGVVRLTDVQKMMARDDIDPIWLDPSSEEFLVPYTESDEGKHLVGKDDATVRVSRQPLSRTTLALSGPYIRTPLHPSLGNPQRRKKRGRGQGPSKSEVSPVGHTYAHRDWDTSREKRYFKEQGWPLELLHRRSGKIAGVDRPLWEARLFIDLIVGRPGSRIGFRECVETLERAGISSKGSDVPKRVAGFAVAMKQSGILRAGSLKGRKAQESWRGRVDPDMPTDPTELLGYLYDALDREAEAKAKESRGR